MHAWTLRNPEVMCDKTNCVAQRMGDGIGVRLVGNGHTGQRRARA